MPIASGPLDLIAAIMDSIALAGRRPLLKLIYPQIPHIYPDPWPLQRSSVMVESNGLVPKAQPAGFARMQPEKAAFGRNILQEVEHALAESSLLIGLGSAVVQVNRCRETLLDRLQPLCG
jgi:hypothetical protein